MAMCQGKRKNRLRAIVFIWTPPDFIEYYGIKHKLARNYRSRQKSVLLNCFHMMEHHLCILLDIPNPQPFQLMARYLGLATEVVLEPTPIYIY